MSPQAFQCYGRIVIDKKELNIYIRLFKKTLCTTAYGLFRTIYWNKYRIFHFIFDFHHILFIFFKTDFFRTTQFFNNSMNFAQSRLTV